MERLENRRGSACGETDTWSFLCGYANFSGTQFISSGKSFRAESRLTLHRTTQLKKKKCWRRQARGAQEGPHDSLLALSQTRNIANTHFNEHTHTHTRSCSTSEESSLITTLSIIAQSPKRFSSSDFISPLICWHQITMGRLNGILSFFFFLAC